jgi:hypothetical protein
VGAFSWPHFAAPYLPAGMPRHPGSPEPSASTNMREHGTRTPGTGTTGVFSFWSLPGGLWEVLLVQTGQRPASSFTELGSSGSATGTAGKSGGQRESVGSDE